MEIESLQDTIKYENICKCPYCGEINFDDFFKTEHDYYEIWECKKCGESFGVHISIQKQFVYHAEKLFE